MEVRQVLTDTREHDLLCKFNRMCFGQIKFRNCIKVEEERYFLKEEESTSDLKNPGL